MLSRTRGPGIKCNQCQLPIVLLRKKSQNYSIFSLEEVWNQTFNLISTAWKTAGVVLKGWPQPYSTTTIFTVPNRFKGSIATRLWLFVQLKFNGVLNGISETAVSEMHYFDRKLIRSTAWNAVQVFTPNAVALLSHYCAAKS